MRVTAEEIASIVKKATTSPNVAGIEGDVLLRDAGVDSLDMMNVFLALEEKYGIKIPDSDIDELDTVNSIVRYLERR